MAKSFSEAVLEIMPLVKQGSDLPFVISHEGGNWNINYFSLNPAATPEEIKTQTVEYLSFLREKDHCAVAHNGAEFANGSYAYVYDKILYARLREEYYLARSSGLDTDELHAMTCFAQDNIGEFSPDVTDYLTTLDRPLASLIELCPFNMKTDHDGWNFNEGIAQEAIDHIERKIAEIINAPEEDLAYVNKQTQRDMDTALESSMLSGDRAFNDENLSVGDYKEINKININDSDIILSENPNAEYRYMVVENRFTEYYNNSGDNNIFTGHTNDYLEAISEFTKRTQYNIDCVQSRRDSLLRSEEIEEAIENIPSNADKGFLDRIHYLSGEYSEAENTGQHHLLKFIETNASEISNNAKDYLVTIDNPVDWLYNELSDGDKFKIQNGVDTDGGIDSGDLFRSIENIVDGELMDNDYREGFIDTKMNEHDSTHIISSLLLNGVDVELGEDTGNELPYYVESNRGYENLFSFRTTDYAEALKTYGDQVQLRVYDLTVDRQNAAVTQGVEYIKLTDEHCLPDGKNANFTGKLIIVDSNSLLPEYRSSTSQLVECTHGNGARPNAKGTSVFCKEMFTGESVVYGRHQILGVADEAKLPHWAKVKLEIQRDPAVFEFGGFHFKPYRQFHKGEVERHLKGDSRPWKMDAAYAMRNMSSDRSLGISTYDWGKTEYSHEKFYAAANSEADIFTCLENGKPYVPNENELYLYNEPPQKEQAKTNSKQYKDCASAIDKEINTVKYDEMPGSARYDLKIALERLNYNYGAENVTAVLAAVVIVNDNDGRYSDANRQWAASVPNPPVDIVRRCTINTHPTIINGLVDKARESTVKAREARPDLLGKINENKQKVEQDKANADAPPKKKKRDGQEV